jgi:hypothetical protein
MLRIRQIALVARDLEPTVNALCDALGVEVCYRDPLVATFGLHNVLMPIGDTLLEIVSPVKEGTTAGRLLDRRGGDGGYMVIFQTDDIARERKRIEALGVRVVWDVALDEITSIHLHPRDVGGAIVSLDEARPPESWHWAGPGWRAHVRRGVVTKIVAAELQADDPSAMSARWGEVLARPVEVRADGTRRIALDDCELRFVAARDGRGDGLGGFDVRAAAGQAPRELSLCGTRVRIG